MSFLIVFVIAVSLSMDAFSLSLAYGTLDLSKKNIIKLSIIVGIYHFVMPLIGLFIGNAILKFFPISPNTIVTIVLCFIGIQMIIETFKNDDDIKMMSNIELLIFGLAVSIDSFSVGIGLNAINNNFILCSLIFSISSFLFTYLGLILGKKISSLIGCASTLIGGIVLIIIGIMYI